MNVLQDSTINDVLSMVHAHVLALNAARPDLEREPESNWTDIYIRLNLPPAFDDGAPRYIKGSKFRFVQVAGQLEKQNGLPLLTASIDQ